MNDLDQIFKNISWILNCKLRIQIDVKNEKYNIWIKMQLKRGSA